jgi:hypothetical protein
VSRLCTTCGKPYYRRSLTEIWDRQAPGSRTGWHKTQMKLCTRCMGPAQARRVLMVAHVRIGRAERRVG